MRNIWEGNQKKFANWLRVENAVLAVRERQEQIPAETAVRVRLSTWMDKEITKAIERRDREIGHDLNAFVEIMRLQIIAGAEEFYRIIRIGADSEFNDEVSKALEKMSQNPDAKWFHDGMTSFDTEDPAMALLIDESCKEIDRQLCVLRNALEEQAEKYKYAIMIGRTHGQHAQPITFGIKLLNWLDTIRRAGDKLSDAASDACVMKLSGAVGMYGTLGPEVERDVGAILNLKPVIATQIVSLDYRARVISELAFISGAVEKIADDLWHMCQTEVSEIREPFGKRQKGSSAMPHKKNPIKLENIRGFAAVVRGYAHAMQELCNTSHERDISHSGPERIILPDAFGVVDHQIRTLANIIRNMEVSTARMTENMEMTYGTFASQKIEMFLKEQGMAAETAYRTVQAACNRAVGQQRHLSLVILEDQNAQELIINAAIENNFNDCFSPANWVGYVDYIFEREREWKNTPKP